MTEAADKLKQRATCHAHDMLVRVTRPVMINQHDDIRIIKIIT